MKRFRSVRALAAALAVLAAGTAATGASGAQAATVAVPPPPVLDRPPAGVTPDVGTTRLWPATDYTAGGDTDYLKTYTLRGVGEHIEVWVASGPAPDGVVGTAFPAGDCRNDLRGATEITDAQVHRLIHEFDTTIVPVESEAFSVPPRREGARPGRDALTDALQLDFSGDGGRTVVLVDNIRDDNFTDLRGNRTFVGGFFSQRHSDLTDRNILTLDAFDWTHRTGDDPPNDPSPEPCRNRVARPNAIEYTVAHEYQHLLQSYIDPGEETFLDEGLSDYAADLTGYGDSTLGVGSPGADDALRCFLGFGTVASAANPAPSDCGGPQNSLTWWEDEGSAAILADYGIAHALMVFLRDRYGPELLRFLHRDGTRQGVAALQAALDAYAGGVALASVLRDLQATVLLDGAVAEGQVTGVAPAEVTTPGLDLGVNLDNPRAYGAPGAAPNGADYVPLTAADGHRLNGAELSSLRFAGARVLPPVPLAWTLADSAALGGPALFSGNDASADASAVLPVRVPPTGPDGGPPTLTYTTSHALERGYDLGFTVVSADGGLTYRALAGTHTVDGPQGPALTGDSGGARTETFDLSAYAGSEELLGFRYVSDRTVSNGGWYVRDLAVAGVPLEVTPALLRTVSAVVPFPVAGWAVQVVGLDAAGRRAHVVRLAGPDASLTDEQVASLAGFPALVAVVGYSDPTGAVRQYAPYTLTVNGVVQAGGR